MGMECARWATPPSKHSRRSHAAATGALWCHAMRRVVCSEGHTNHLHPTLVGALLAIAFPPPRSLLPFAAMAAAGPIPTADAPSGCGPCLLAVEAAACTDRSNPAANLGYFEGGPPPQHGHTAVLYTDDIKYLRLHFTLIDNG